MAKIAFIGLGNMGLPMAKNLTAAGYALTAYDLSSQARESAEQAGLFCASSLRQAVDGSDTLITMLPKGEHVLSVYHEAMALMEEGTTLIDCSTIDIESAKALHDLAATHNLRSLDAPVSGGITGAMAGSLTFMIGGDETTYHDNIALFEAMGKNIVYCGSATSGQAAKICNNMILGISMIAVCEAFILGEKLGLSPDALFKVASTSSGQCWSLTSYCPVPGPVPNSPANKGYLPGFAAELMEKDLLLAKNASDTAAANTPLGRQAAELYAAYVADSGRGVDFSGIIYWLRDRRTNSHTDG